MKSSVFITGVSILVLGLSVVTTYAAAEKLNSTISHVTVFADRAVVTRQGSATLTGGEHTVVFSGLPSSADDASFHVSARGVAGITLLGLRHKMEQHLEAQQEKVAALERQISDLEENHEDLLKDQITVLEERRKLLLALGKSGSDQMGREIKVGGIDLRSWEGAYQFFTRELTTVTDELRQSNQQLDGIQEKLNFLRRELDAVSVHDVQTSKTVEVDLRLDKGGEITVSLDYLVPDVTWQPLYDARLFAEKNQVELGCFAEVTQRTGEDWKNVEMTLSTSRPSEGTDPGAFAPWYLSVLGRYLSDSGNRRQLTAEQIKNMPITTVQEILIAQLGGLEKFGELRIRSGRGEKTTYIVDGVEIKDPLGGGLESEYGSAANSPASLQMAQVENDLQSLSALFVISGRWVVLSGGEATRVPITNSLLDGKMNLVSRPKNHPAAYRFVDLKNQGEAALMPGEISLFAGSHFLGKTYLPELVAPDQEFELPFGLENDVTVKREIVARKKSQNGDKSELEETVKITLANRGRIERTLSLEEPLPVSRDESVKIKKTDLIPAPNTRDQQGKGTWEINLKAGEEVTISISYKIEHPVNAVISGL